MIEVNLLPGGKKRVSRGPKLSFKLPSAEALPTDRWVLGAGIVVLAAVVTAGYLYWTLTSEREELRVSLDAAVADSARYADLIEQNNRMIARRDSIAQRVAIIQEIDGDRYVWPHVLDEVARALPDYTWLRGITQTESGEDLQIRIEGQAGNNLAVTQFMKNLEASFFIRDVQLISTEQVVDGASNRIVNQFELEVRFERPPPELLETVPLLGASGPDTPGSSGTTGPSGP